MKNSLTNLKSPALISLILTLPFVILELINRRNFNEGFPIVLFGLIWLLPMAFIIVLMPIMQNIRAGNNIMANPIHLLFGVVFLALIAMIWVGIISDQMPCFIGTLNCD